VHVSKRHRTLLLLYVDDMLITSDDIEYITFVKVHLHEQFVEMNSNKNKILS